MRVGFIGAGIMGKTMGLLLGRCGYEIVGYFSRSETTAYRVAKEVGGKFFSDVGKLAVNCDILFVTTPDDAIPQIAVTLGNLECLRPGQFLVHMSGLHTSGILEPALSEGIYGLSMHPLQSCASAEEALLNLPLSLFSLEGSPEALKMGKVMISRIGAKFFVLSREDKVLYHAAACIASNYLVVLFDAARELFDLSGVGKDFQAEALISLMEGTLGNLKVMVPEDAFTGPISRGDMGTVSMHIMSIEEKSPGMLDMYKTLGRQALNLARKQGKLAEEKIQAFSDLLDKLDK